MDSSAAAAQASGQDSDATNGAAAPTKSRSDSFSQKSDTSQTAAE